MTTVGETLIKLLESRGVELVFGIPGVHTIELYRGLANSSIRHITPRHEQSAGFMADGYARVSGKPGVAFVITGPGLTNTITAMAQARADSVPMLVVSSVNATTSLGKGLGFLHELPDQRALMQTFALFSHRVESGDDLPAVLDRAFALFSSGRPGPAHIEIPLDVMGREADLSATTPAKPVAVQPDAEKIASAAARIAAARHPVILVGGGAKQSGERLSRFGETLDAPVVATANARGLMHRHPLLVPASPSLKAVRRLIAEADLVIALGAELGPTDYDMYADGRFAAPENMIRVDIDADQLARWPAKIAIQADCAMAIEALLAALPPEVRAGDGADRAEGAKTAAWEEIGPAMQGQVAVIEVIRDALSGAIIVGDSTQPVYAGNLYYDHDRAAGWFNAATGYGALGYGPPAAIGASLAAPDAPVVCLVGDGGFQFTLAEIGSAVDAETPVIFLVWNNDGYGEIETSMVAAGVEPIGVSPTPPDFMLLAAAYGVGAERLAFLSDLPDALRRARALGKPCLIEIRPELIGP